MTLIESIADGVTDIQAHKGRTALQLVGVLLGVASVVTVLALVDAGRRKSLEFMAEIGGLRKILIVNQPSQAVVHTALQDSNVGLTYADVQALRGIDVITQVDPIANERLLVRREEFQKEWDIDGVTPDYSFIYKFHPARGRFISSDDVNSASRVCVLGDSAAREVFGSDDPIGRTIFLDDVGMTVVGIMQRKEYYFNQTNHNALEWMNRKIFVPITSVYKRFNGDRDMKVAYINAIVDSSEHNSKAASEIRAVLKRRHRGVTDFDVFDRKSRLEEQAARGKEFNIIFLTSGAVSLLVGGVVIMNILLASFQERVREVGVRKALGANPLHIVAQFLVESVLVTLLGGGLGILLGLGFTQAVATLIQQPATVTPHMMALGFLTSVTVGVFFGLYPAVKAARLNPVEALRYE